VEIHRRVTPPEAMALARGIERYTPMFYEDPICPDSFVAMGRVADQTSIGSTACQRPLAVDPIEAATPSQPSCN
jgi:galactonate dehydratase